MLAVLVLVAAGFCATTTEKDIKESEVSLL